MLDLRNRIVVGLVAVAALVIVPMASAATVAQLQSQANNQVGQAEQQGSAAEQALANSVFVHHLPGNAVTPGQQALATALYNAGQDQGVAPTVPTTADFFLHPKKAAKAAAHAHSAGCYGAQESERYHTILGGAIVEDEWVKISGWCGNGSVITWMPWFTFHHWAQWPYCYVNSESSQGWDGSTTWAHGGVFQTNGEEVGGIPVACIGDLGSMNAVQRVAANGYSDHYNDMF